MMNIEFKDVKVPIDLYLRTYNRDRPYVKRLQTLSDKIKWLNLYDVSDLKTLCADKIKLHDYCKQKLGVDICPKTIKVFNNVQEYGKWIAKNIHALPNKFVIKCNHGCGYNLIVKDKAQFLLEKSIAMLSKWMSQNYTDIGGELHYYSIDRKIFIEEYLRDNIKDYKLFCFNGKPLLFQVISDRRQKNAHINYYDLDWNFLNVQAVMPNSPSELDEKPHCIDLMVEYARTLSQDFKLVRVDFYEVDGTLYLGELTFTPANGKMTFKPESFDKWIGDQLQL